MFGFGTDNLIQALSSIAILTPIVVAFTGAVKGFVETRYIPLVAILIGTVLGLIVLGLTVLGGLVGALAGLASVGLYEFGKTTIADGRG